MQGSPFVWAYPSQGLLSTELALDRVCLFWYCPPQGLQQALLFLALPCTGLVLRSAPQGLLCLG